MTMLMQWLPVISMSIIISGLVGNITAGTVILSSKSFKNLTGFYLLSLSVADLVILIVLGLPYTFSSSVHDFLLDHGIVHYVGEWIFQTCVIVSTLTITAFTVERYLAICHPFFVQSLPKKSRVKKIVITIWSTSVLLSILPVAQVFIDWQVKNENLKLINADALPYITDVWASLYFVMPMSIITVMYVLIWLKLREKLNESQAVDRADVRTTVMFVIIITFSLSWGPYNFFKVVYANTYINERHPGTEVITSKLYTVYLWEPISYPLSSALKPVIYLMISKKFRQALKDLSSKTVNRNVVRWSLRWTRTTTNHKSNTHETTAPKVI